MVEEGNIITVSFEADNKISVNVLNAGMVDDVEFSTFTINGEVISHRKVTVKDRNSFTFIFTYVWTVGNAYTIELISKSGNSGIIGCPCDIRDELCCHVKHATCHVISNLDRETEP